jgi:uncharacterized membrane protein
MASSKARSRNRQASGKNARATAGNGRAASRAGGGSAAQSARTPPTAEQTSAPTVQATPASPAGAVNQAKSVKRAERRPVEVTPEPVRPSGPPLWLQIVSLVLAIVGLGVSAYETYAHFNGSHLAGCPTKGNGAFNCTAVITSPQSMVFGVIPVAVLGLLFYVFVVAIMTPWAWRMQRREVAWLRLASMIAGMGFVMYLIYAELYQIGSICEYCTGVHIITFLLFCITVISAAFWGLGKSESAA